MDNEEQYYDDHMYCDECDFHSRDCWCWNGEEYEGGCVGGAAHD